MQWPGAALGRGIVGIQYRGIQPGAGEEFLLRGAIGVQIAVKIQVVARDVREDRDRHVHGLDPPLRERVRGHFHRHHIGTRDNLRDRGSVTLRLSVSGTSTRSVFPGPRPYSWPVGIDPGEPESIVHLQFDDLSARRSLELVLEELHGNTTHRIDRIDLRWRLN